MIRRYLFAIPLTASVLVLLAGEAAHAQMPGPESADTVPPWAWSIAVGGLLALVALLGSALITLAGRYAVAQLNRLSKIEESVEALRSDIHELKSISARVSSIEHVCRLMHSDGK